jgi:hypothetical protein
VKPINKLLKKDYTFEWTLETQMAFSNIKKAIITAPVLVSVDFNKDFILYSFASKETIACYIYLEKSKRGRDSYFFHEKNFT